jgi:hypothetical protein
MMLGGGSLDHFDMSCSWLPFAIINTLRVTIKQAVTGGTYLFWSFFIETIEWEIKSEI